MSPSELCFGKRLRPLGIPLLKGMRLFRLVNCDLHPQNWNQDSCCCFHGFSFSFFGGLFGFFWDTFGVVNWELYVPCVHMYMVYAILMVAMTETVTWCIESLSCDVTVHHSMQYIQIFVLVVYRSYVVIPKCNLITKVHKFSRNRVISVDVPVYLRWFLTLEGGAVFSILTTVFNRAFLHRLIGEHL